MAKKKKAKKPLIPEYRRVDVSRGMEFTPQTPAGKTRLEMQNRGPFRPGKTEQDHAPATSRLRVKDAQRRVSASAVQKAAA